ncbi:MAG: hypothetical protein A2W37_11700 [Chloroflexi bacterium RBG_16_63_12]|nr:MAG: hypothetical protein A2W37_11700 [Chloroflexi bacterium RBG_16_63_12]
MNRNTWIVAAIGAVVVAAIGLGIYFALPHPTQLTGDPWDYTILPSEAPKDWNLTRQGVITPHDVALESAERSLPITASLSLNNMEQLYYAKYQPPETSEYLDFSIQIITYKTDADAAAALAAGGPGAGWEKVGAATIGDESRVWHFVNVDPTISQNIYRVDFRFLNGVASVAMIGTAHVLPNADEPMRYARQILEKMRYKATPQEVKRLTAARLPDLRKVLLTQDEIAKLDEKLSGRWQVDSRFMPQWTPTDQLSSPSARELLTRLGRASGYQMFLVKALSAEEKKDNISEGLFQQASGYKQADGAQGALNAMIGLEQGVESPAPPQVGDKTRGWSALLTSTQSDGTQITLAVSEIDFQVGRFVGSIRLQSRPLAEAELTSGQLENLQLAVKFATGLAINLKAVEK